MEFMHGLFRNVLNAKAIDIKNGSEPHLKKSIVKNLKTWSKRMHLMQFYVSEQRINITSKFFKTRDEDIYGLTIVSTIGNTHQNSQIAVNFNTSGLLHVQSEIPFHQIFDNFSAKNFKDLIVQQMNRESDTEGTIEKNDIHTTKRMFRADNTLCWDLILIHNQPNQPTEKVILKLMNSVLQWHIVLIQILAENKKNI